MSFERYIQGLVNAENRPTYEWSDWEFKSYYLFETEEGFLKDISDSAAAALTLASGEWIRARLAPFDRDPKPAQILGAGWAYLLDPSRVEYFEPHDPLWRGPFRGPLNLMIVTTMDTFFVRDEDPEVRNRAFWMANIARYVLEEQASTFDDWWAWAVGQLQTFHPPTPGPKSLFDTNLSLGEPVGPSVFDPNATYAPAQAGAELVTYVRSKAAGNPFFSI